MSAVERCPICKNEFDNFNYVPLLLPCDHTVCMTCLNNQLRTQKQNVCPQQGCGKFSKVHPRNLQENQLIMSQILKEENQLESIQTAVEIFEDRQKASKQMLGELAKKQNNYVALIIQLARQTIFKDTTNIVEALKKDNCRDKETLEGLKFVAELIQEEGEQNLDIQVEQIINQEHAEFRENQVKQEIQRLGLIHQQMDQILGGVFENLARQLNQQGQIMVQVQDQKQIRQPSLEENKIQIQLQKSKNQFIHLFEDQSKTLHTFNITNEVYKRTKIQIEVPVYHRSVQFQNFWYLIGGKINQKEIKNTWKVNEQGKCTQMPDLQCAKRSFGIAVIKGIIITAGGWNIQTPSKVVEMLDIANPTNWSYGEPLPFKIQAQTLVTDRQEENVYSYGGANETNQVTGSILKYEFSNEK